MSRSIWVPLDENISRKQSTIKYRRLTINRARLLILTRASIYYSSNVKIYTIIEKGLNEIATASYSSPKNMNELKRISGQIDLIPINGKISDPVKAQLDQYLNRALDDCINNYKHIYKVFKSNLNVIINAMAMLDRDAFLKSFHYCNPVDVHYYLELLRTHLLQANPKESIRPFPEFTAEELAQVEGTCHAFIITSSFCRALRSENYLILKM